MSKTLQVGNKVFNYPSQGTGQGHGEDATDWAEAVSTALADFLGPNDILLTTTVIANDASTPVVIPDLSFNLAEVQHINVEFLIQRTYTDGGTVILTESGKLYGNYNQTDFVISMESVGADTGIEIDVNASGQFTYTSTNLPNHINSFLSFKAQTIDG